MVYTLVLPLRHMFKLEEFIRKEHLEALIKLTLLTSTTSSRIWRRVLVAGIRVRL